MFGSDLLNFFIYDGQYVARDPGKSYTAKSATVAASADGNLAFEEESGMIEFKVPKFLII